MANPAQGWINHLRRQASSDQACTNNTRAVGNQAAPCASPSVDGISPCGELVLQDIPPARKRLKSPTKPVKARDRSLIDRQQASDFPARPLAKAKGRLWSEGDPLPTRSRPAPTQTRRCPRYGGPQKPKEDDDSSVKKSIGQPETRSISQEQLVAEVKGIYAGLVMVESKCIEVDSSQRAQNEPETRPKPNNEQWQALIALHRTLLHEHHDFFLASQHPSAPSLGLRGLASRHALIALQRSLLHKHHDFFLASQHPSTTSPKLNNEQCQALTALYRTLLHEHHDFLSQHPSTTSPGLRRLASKYAMPARMWRQGIHSFFDLLHHSPASLEHMLTFIYLAYSMMSLLYETVPHFEDIYKAYSMLALLYETVPGIQDTWIECLGDLGRYRMPIEDEDPLAGDREIWTEVSRYWYSKASDKAPTTGRLYHHLAILARPDAVKQLFYYTKSLCVAIPFKSARDSIRTLLDPIINGPQRDYNVDSMDFPQTARPLPDDWSLRGLPWAESLFPDDWFSGDNDDDDDEGTFRLPSPPLKDTYGRISWGASGGGRCSSPGFYSDPFDDLQRKFHSEAGTMPRCILNPSYLPYTFPQKFLGLAVLTAMAIPIVSAELPGRDVVTMAWAFGIMANVPSVYVLANPPVPSRVDGGAEEVLWKIARGWGLTFGPVFAAVLVVLLRAILPRGKRMAFIALVFAMSLVVMLLLKLFMRDDTWSVLDLLALCVSFCGVAAYIVTSEPRGRNAADEDLGLEGGRPRWPQATLAINQPGQTPQPGQPEDDPDDGSAAVHSSVPSDDPFIIGDDSTLGDGESRI